jgi:hypothetical protein
MWPLSWTVQIKYVVVPRRFDTNASKHLSCADATHWCLVLVQGIALVASTKGGVNIEKVAEEDPRAIVKVLNNH